MKLYSLVLAGTLLVATSANSVAMPTVNDARKFASDAQAFVSTKQFGIGAAVGGIFVGSLAIYCIKKHFVAKSKIVKKP